jgi:hypothetical protein
MDRFLLGKLVCLKHHHHHPVQLEHENFATTFTAKCARIENLVRLLSIMMRGYCLSNGSGCAFRCRTRQIAETQNSDRAVVLVDYR